MKIIFNDIITKNILKFICYHPIITQIILLLTLDIFLVFKLSLNNYYEYFWYFIMSLVFIIFIIICIAGILDIFFNYAIMSDNLEDWFNKKIKIKIKNL